MPPAPQCFGLHSYLMAMNDAKLMAMLTIYNEWELVLYLYICTPHVWSFLAAFMIHKSLFTITLVVIHLQGQQLTWAYQIALLFVLGCFNFTFISKSVMLCYVNMNSLLININVRMQIYYHVYWSKVIGLPLFTVGTCIMVSSKCCDLVSKTFASKC